MVEVVEGAEAVEESLNLLSVTLLKRLSMGHIKKCIVLIVKRRE